ncbi:MAG: hypothetical protein LDL15_04800 [Yonghaparkia sp.]|nr:hypothetical protein [Microcella sp.]
MKAAYERLAEDLRVQHPGVADLLRLYGEYEAASDRTAAYLEAMRQPPCYAMTDVCTG